jgi:hypothetical protein
MRKSRHTALAAAALMLAMAITFSGFGKDYWIEKPFSSWSEPEALALLTDSPWSRPTTIPGNYGGRSTPTMIDSTPGAAARGVMSSAGLGGSNSVPMYVRWYSSEKVRQALARYSQLRGGLADPEIQQFLAQQVPDHTIAISCQVTEPFVAATFATVAPNTFLTSKKDKDKKIPLKAYSSPKERQDGFAVFQFAREIDGKPTVDLADDEIVFSTQIGTLKIRVAYKLARMLVAGKLDL